MTSGDARRLAQEFFREVDGHYDERYSHVPPKVDDLAAIARLEVEELENWGIEELFTSRPLDSETTFAMNALNCKRRNGGLSPVSTVRDVIDMALAATNTD